MEILRSVFICFLSLIGITALIKQFCFLIFKKDCFKNAMFLVRLDNENFENTIHCAYHTLKWQGVAKNVLAFDNSLTSKNKVFAKKLIADYGFLFCDDNNINNKLKDIFNEWIIKTKRNSWRHYISKRR